MSAKLRAALATVLVMETIEGAHYAARIALEASEPPVTGLDVERLARALGNSGVGEHGDGTTWNPTTLRISAESIIHEYARLSEGREP